MQTFTWPLTKLNGHGLGLFQIGEIAEYYYRLKRRTVDSTVWPRDQTAVLCIAFSDFVMMRYPSHVGRY